MDKLIYNWYCNILKMEPSEISDNYANFGTKFGIEQDYTDPSACGITAAAIINKLHDYYKGNIVVRKLTDIKNMVFANKNITTMIAIDSYATFNLILKSEYNFKGHTLVIISLGSEKYLLLQSYVQHYSLLEWMKSEKLIYSKKEIMELLDFFLLFEKERYFTKEMVLEWYKHIRVIDPPMFGHVIQKGFTYCISLENTILFPNIKKIEYPRTD